MITAKNFSVNKNYKDENFMIKIQQIKRYVIFSVKNDRT